MGGAHLPKIHVPIRGGLLPDETTVAGWSETFTEKNLLNRKKFKTLNQLTQLMDNFCKRELFEEIVALDQAGQVLFIYSSVEKIVLCARLRPDSDVFRVHFDSKTRCFWRADESSVTTTWHKVGLQVVR